MISTITVELLVQQILNGNTTIDLSDSIMVSPIDPSKDTQIAYTRHFGRPVDYSSGAYALASDNPFHLNPNLTWRQTQGLYYRELPNSDIKGWVFESDYEPAASYRQRVKTAEYGTGQYLFCSRLTYENYFFTPETVAKAIKQHPGLPNLRYSNYTPVNVPPKERKIILDDLIPIFDAIKRSSYQITFKLPYSINIDTDILLTISDIYQCRGDAVTITSNDGQVMNAIHNLKSKMQLQRKLDTTNQQLKEAELRLEENRQIFEKNIAEKELQLLNQHEVMSVEHRRLKENISVSNQTISDLEGKLAQMHSVNDDLMHERNDLLLQNTNLSKSVESLNKRNAFDGTLWAGVKKPDKEAINFSLDRGANIDAIEDNATPFFWALVHNQDMANHLVSKGPDVTCVFPDNHPNQGQYVFEHIVHQLTMENMIWPLDLIRNDSDKKEEIFSIAHAALPEPDKLIFAKKMAFKYAKQAGALHLLKRAIVMGVSINETDPESGESLLHIAAFYNNCPVVEFLLQSGAYAYGLTKWCQYPEDLTDNMETKALFEAYSKEKLNNCITNHVKSCQFLAPAYLDLENRKEKLRAKLKELEKDQDQLISNRIYGLQ